VVAKACIAQIVFGLFTLILQVFILVSITVGCGVCVVTEMAVGYRPLRRAGNAKTDTRRYNSTALLLGETTPNSTFSGRCCGCILTMETLPRDQSSRQCGSDHKPINIVSFDVAHLRSRLRWVP
jgi:hypothetical protein